MFTSKMTTAEMEKRMIEEIYKENQRDINFSQQMAKSTNSNSAANMKTGAVIGGIAGSVGGGVVSATSVAAGSIGLAAVNSGVATASAGPSLYGAVLYGATCGGVVGAAVGLSAAAGLWYFSPNRTNKKEDLAKKDSNTP